MLENNIRIEPTSDAEMLIIEPLAKNFDLDCDDLSAHQFVTAKKNGVTIGFGRLRKYPGCAEIATVGVLIEEQKKGVGTLIVKELIRTGPPVIFITCVIPEFFSKLGFQLVKQYPVVLQKKVDFCKSYNFNDDQVFVMKIVK